METHNLIIIGSGPAGLTAAIYAGRAFLKPLVFEGKKPGGQLMGTSFIENWPGEQSILGPTLMMRMRDHAQHFGAQLVQESIEKVDFSNRPFTLTTTNGTAYRAHCVIIASGADPILLNIPGEKELWGKGVTTCAVCDGAFYKDLPVVVIGGGDSAMENASFLYNYTKDITIIQLPERLTASTIMQERILSQPGIKILYQQKVTEILHDGSQVTGVTMTNTQTNAQTQIPTRGVFISIGLRPNTQPFAGQLEFTHAYIKVTNLTHTSVEGVFAAGDVHDYRYRQAITSSGFGCMASLDAERYLKSIGK